MEGVSLPFPKAPFAAGAFPHDGLRHSEKTAYRMFAGKCNTPDAIIGLCPARFNWPDAQTGHSQNGHCGLAPRCPFFSDCLGAGTVITSPFPLRIAALAGNIPLRDGALSGIKGHPVAVLHVIDRSTVSIMKFSRVQVADIGPRLRRCGGHVARLDRSERIRSQP